MKVEDDGLKPLAAVDGQPAFAEAWQAQALAMADTLVNNGLFSATTWSATLGERLREAGAAGEPDNQETYYACVLAALEKLVDDNSEIDRASMRSKREDWERAYLATPHGKPVKLETGDGR